MYIFISHSSKDAKIAQALCGFLEEKGINCFIAPRDICSGYEYAAEITEGIDRSDGILLILSENANHSPHVLRELESFLGNRSSFVNNRICCGDD